MVFDFFRKKDKESSKPQRHSTPKQAKPSTTVKPADKSRPAAAPVSIQKHSKSHSDFGSATDVEVFDSTSELSPAAEEAAMLYAGNQIEQALEVLLGTIKSGLPDLESWLMLFDLYQQKNMQKEFEELALNFVLKFERSPPAWREVKAAGGTVFEQEEV
ncbi:MAG: hypothetical protein ACREUV_10995, partial [Burkholderiales bacterium]